MIEFYKARGAYFYSGIVEKIDFAMLDNEVRSRTDQLVNMKTEGLVPHFMHHDHIPNYPQPMIAFSANYFEVNLLRLVLLMIIWRFTSCRVDFQGTHMSLMTQ